nr:MAG TPA: hypothetical protein [Caudoviricetes sp.]
MAFEDNLLYYFADCPQKYNMSMNRHCFSDG